MGFIFVRSTALKTADFVNYDAATFNIILIPSTSTVYNSLIAAGFLDRNILWQPAT